MQNTALLPNTYDAALGCIARDAQLYIDLGHVTEDQAIGLATKSYIDAAYMAAKRIGPFAATLSKENKDAHAFYGMVAHDVRDNTSRPSVGKCGDYVRGQLKSYTED